MGSKREFTSVRSHNASHEPRIRSSRYASGVNEAVPSREPHTIVGALRKFELHRCLLRCGRECKGSGYVGPKFGTHVPARGAGKYLVHLLILERLSRKHVQQDVQS